MWINFSSILEKHGTLNTANFYSMREVTKIQLFGRQDDVYSAKWWILKGDKILFETVLFEKFNAIVMLRPQHYDSYRVICHADNILSAEIVIMPKPEKRSLLIGEFTVRFQNCVWYQEHVLKVRRMLLRQFYCRINNSFGSTKIFIHLL